MPYSPQVAQLLGFAPLQSLGVYLLQAYVQLCDGHQPTPGMHQVVAPSTTLSRGSLILFSCSPAILYIWWSIQLWSLEESHPILPPSVCGREGCSFPGLVPSHDMVDSESAMGIKFGDSGVVIWCQVDEFTNTWLAEQFVACSHISWVHW